MTPLPISRASSFSLLPTLLFLFPFTSSPSPFLLFLPFSLLHFARFHVSRLVPLFLSPVFSAPLSSSSLLSPLLSSLAGRFAGVPVYVRLPVRVRGVHRDRGEGTASYVPLRSRALSSRFSKKIHHVTTMIVAESNISRIPEPPPLCHSSLLEYPRRASRLCAFLC